MIVPYHLEELQDAGVLLVLCLFTKLVFDPIFGMDYQLKLSSFLFLQILHFMIELMWPK